MPKRHNETLNNEEYFRLNTELKKNIVSPRPITKRSIIFPEQKKSFIRIPV
jgi:hypothetical protein